MRMKMDGFNDCIIGTCFRIGQLPIVAYDKRKVIEKLMKDMPKDEALEYFEYNMLGAWVGPTTPCFIDDNSLH
jgi:hypothetical protein